MAEKRKMKLGLIGAGNMGNSHANRIRNLEQIEITAVCDTDHEKAARLVKKPGGRAFTDYQELIAAGGCEAVLICTPHYSHTEIGIAALQSGLHVLMEKPISVHKADCEKLLAAHTDPELVFAAMFNQRTNPCYRKVKQLIDEGELGRLMRMNWIITNWFRSQRYYDDGGWRATWKGEGGGVLLNQCPHQLDLMQWLFGMPERISARCGIGKYHHIEVEDEVTAFLEYPDGATGVFITSTGEAPGTNRLEITGTRGRLVVENDALHFIRNEVPCDEFLRTSEKAFAAPETWEVSFPVSGAGGQHTEVLENFAAAVLHGKPLLAPAEEGIHSVELANAMLLSSFRDGPVMLPMDGAEYEVLLKKRVKESTFVKQVKKAETADFENSF